VSKVQYQKQWSFPSKSNPNKTYKVSLTMDGKYICGCWPFLQHRDQDCEHIALVKGGQGQEVAKLTQEEQFRILLDHFAEQGYRYIDRTTINNYPWEKRDLQLIKANPNFEDVKTFRIYDFRIIVAKEKPEVYQRELDNFKHMIESYDFRKVQNREELKKQLHKEFFDLTQHILFNKTQVINPNLPQGSVYNSGVYGKQLVALQRRYKWLRSH